MNGITSRREAVAMALVAFAVPLFAQAGNISRNHYAVRPKEGER